MTLLAKLAAAPGLVAAGSTLHGLKWGTVSTPGGGGQGRLGQAVSDRSVKTANLRPVGGDRGGISRDGSSRGSEAGSPVSSARGLHYLTAPAARGGQGCSASSRSSCLKRFLEARLGRSRRRQGGRHWSSTLCGAGRV